MRVLLVGAGGVGGAIAMIAARRPFFEAMVVADYDGQRAAAVAASTGDPRITSARVDAADSDRVAALIAEHRSDVLVNATDPRFVMPLFRAALDAGIDYLDMAMSLSRPHPTEPYSRTGVKLGDEQFALASAWEESGALALVGHRHRTRDGRRVRPVRRGRALLLDRRARGAGRLEPRRVRLRLRAQLLHLDDH